jgi:hypothetical protein
LITFVTWLWGDKYPAEYVYRLKSAIARNSYQPYRFLCVTDHDLPGVYTTPIPDPDLTEHKGCLARLRLFDEVWQEEMGIPVGERVVNLDLDLIVTGEIDGLWRRGVSFAILKGANIANPCPFNGSVFMLRAGEHTEVWNRFSLDALATIKRYEFPDDQGWLWHMIPDADGWKAGIASGIYAFQKRGWTSGDQLPANAKIVAFPGKRDPAQYTHLEWVQRHWLA